MSKADQPEIAKPAGAKPAAVPAPAPSAAESAALLGSLAGLPTPRSRLKPALLVAGAVAGLTGGIAIYFAANNAGQPPAAPPAAAQPAPTPAAPPAPPAAAEPPIAEAPLRPGLSWDAAEQAYAAPDYAKAHVAFSELLKASLKSTATSRISDFLRLRIAQCLRNLHHGAESRRAFQEAAAGTSSLVRSVACYELARMDAIEGQPLAARTRAYQALANLVTPSRRSAFETDAEFLVAYALTCKAATVLGGDPPSPTPDLGEVDLFRNLNEKELRRLLEEGADAQAAALLGPRVLRRKAAGGAGPWAAISCGGPLEDLVARVSAEAAMEVRWKDVDPAARRRPVVMNVEGASAQRILEVACGAAGLVARFTGAEAVISDPATCPSATDSRGLLAGEAVSVWRRFLLHTPQDPRLAYGHFALAVLQHRTGDAGGAMAEYRLVAQSYPTDRLAPQARLRIARIKIDLKDSIGACEELLDLLNHYPDCPALDEVYLGLGRAAFEAGRLEEAFITFKKLYFLDLSAVSRAGSSLGAGRCALLQGLHEEAARWLGRRLELPRSAEGDADLPEAYALLAQAEASRDRLPQAVQAYRESLKLTPKSEVRADIVIELARILAQQEDFVGALSVLERLGPKEATPEQADEVLLTKVNILRRMHLPERARDLLIRGVPLAGSPAMRTRLTLELARATADAGDLRGAHQTLSDLLPKIEAGPEAHQAALELAELALGIANPAQAATVCNELLKSPCSETVRRKAQGILSRAFAQQKDYDRAAMALTGTADRQAEAKP